MCVVYRNPETGSTLVQVVRTATPPPSAAHPTFLVNLEAGHTITAAHMWSDAHTEPPSLMHILQTLILLPWDGQGMTRLLNFILKQD